jgi:hypothetical protein
MYSQTWNLIGTVKMGIFKTDIYKHFKAIALKEMHFKVLQG